MKQIIFSLRSKKFYTWSKSRYLYFPPFYFAQINGKHKGGKKEKVFCLQINGWRYYQDWDSQDNIISSLCFMLFSDSILQISSALKISSAGPSSAVHLETPAWPFHVTKHNTESALRVFQRKPDAVFLYLLAHSQSCTAVRDVQLYQISL